MHLNLFTGSIDTWKLKKEKLSNFCMHHMMCCMMLCMICHLLHIRTDASY